MSREGIERGLRDSMAAIASWVAARPRFVGGLLIFAVLYGLLINAWVAEDAYISLRSVEQVLAGNGPRWNPHERVQVYTHPLWFWGLVGARLLVPHPFFAAVALGLICSLLAIALLYFEIRRRRGPLLAVIVVLAFLSSKAVMDYSTSGLENSLSYLLLLAFLALSWRSFEQPETHGAGTLFLAVLAVSLLAANRLDALPLTLPLLAVMVVTYARRRGVVRASALLVAGAVPLLASTAFSLVYYGMPVANTVYAKVLDGAGFWTTFRHGATYALMTPVFDPLLAVVVGFGLVAAFRARSMYWRAIGAGIVIYVTATILAGGDFMVGRFYAVVFVAALFTLAHHMDDLGASRLALGLLVYLVFPLNPLHPFADRYNSEETIGLVDERAFYSRELSLEACIATIISDEECPDHIWTREGRQFANASHRVQLAGNIGVFGYRAGLDKIVVDGFALSDAFLARLPVEPNRPHRVGHGARVIPVGYFETLETGINQIQDPALRAYYDKVSVLTQQTPLLSRERLETIVRFNLGRYDGLLEEVTPAGGVEPAPVITTDSRGIAR